MDPGFSVAGGVGGSPGTAGSQATAERWAWALVQPRPLCGLWSFVLSLGTEPWAPRMLCVLGQ